jgi:hypothetical protein
MRVETVENKFKPISIVLETPEEVAKFYAILNHSKIVSSLNISQASDEIRASILREFNDVRKLSVPWYDKLEDAIIDKVLL